MLDLATAAFYTHDKLGGFLLVALVCGTMILVAAWIAYTNFGPPAKRREQENSSTLAKPDAP